MVSVFGWVYTGTRVTRDHSFRRFQTHVLYHSMGGWGQRGKWGAQTVSRPSRWMWESLSSVKIEEEPRKELDPLYAQKDTLEKLLKVSKFEEKIGTNPHCRSSPGTNVPSILARSTVPHWLLTPWVFTVTHMLLAYLLSIISLVSTLCICYFYFRWNRIEFFLNKREKLNS